MCTWHIFSDAQNNYFWRSTENSSNVSPLPPPIPPTPPSMFDLLLHTHHAPGTTDNNSFSLSNSLFKTGSGKNVTVSPNGLIRAKALLQTVDCPQPPQLVTSSGVKQAPMKFHTAGGRSISISNDALQRARSLLGDPDVGDFFKEGDAGNSIFSFSDSTITPQVKLETSCMKKSFTYPLRDSRLTEVLSQGNGNNLITKFDAVGDENGYSWKSREKLLPDINQAPESTVYHSSLNGFSSKEGSHRGPLVDVSNTSNIFQTNNARPSSGKRRLGLRVTVSPFKKPRSSKLYPVPSDKDVGNFPNLLSQLSSGVSRCKRKVSSRYPFQYPRMYMKEFFTMLPLEKKVRFPCLFRQMTSGSAEKYIFHDGHGDNSIGAEALVHVLAHHGASVHFASKEWVMNHYKWIVWKLACYERCYPARCGGKFLTASNVLEELKYRYEREVNHGHRSTIKKILEGDALPSSMMILCISSIHSDYLLESGTTFETGVQSREAVKIELTDGWYSVNAILDVPLSKQIAAGRLFVGQKLRIWGAGLCGWDGPVSPLEVSPTVNLILHINGTYRAHWGERLGFCRQAGPPLAFRCIKSNGGQVPQTLAGITRIYPILYKQRLSTGRSVVISERMENKMSELHSQRRSAVVDGIISEYQNKGKSLHIYDDSESEGAKIYNMLETAEDPEFLMADMSPEQLNSFSAYQAKLNAIRKSEMENLIEKALKDAGLVHREVTPFMKLRVVGLTYKTQQDKSKEGIVTIWNPTEKQRQELVEGEAYVISGLKPSGSDSDILHLQTRGSTSKWLPISSRAREQFKPFFSSRKSSQLSCFSDIPLSIEFDIVAYVVHVGKVYTSSQQKKQWIFVTDGSIMSSQLEKLTSSLLAICFCSPLIDYDSFTPINYNLAGSTVGFCNLIKREKDHRNHIWVAEATESSTYYLNFDSPHCSHLQNAARFVGRWANNSSLIIEKLKEKVLYAIGDDCKA
ncbi:hypothetical protein RJT34_22438 [Clitoria ternatea]|uniref:Breast cancer type 2 susceptibility protein n=1 Tax=Clitoria ternatea TaxID=43366 RepID=A0AAN9IVP4_CLITE